MKTPEEISEVKLRGPMALVGSKLKKAEKETIAAAILRIAIEKNKQEWEKVYAKEIEAELTSEPIYKLEPLACWDAFNDMIDEKLLRKDKDGNGEYVVVTEKLLEILS